jgi:hypothetical protein
MKILDVVSTRKKCYHLLCLPMYRVSPQLFVTKEHIISESASTPSSAGFSGSLLLPLVSTLFRLSPLVLYCGSGDAKELRGVEPAPSFGVLCEGDTGFDPGTVDCLRDSERFLSANRFSNVPKSVRPLSSSLRSPTNRLAIVFLGLKHS